MFIYEMNGKLTRIIDAKSGVRNGINPSISSQGYLEFGQQVFTGTGKYLWGFNPYVNSPNSNLESVGTVVIDKNQNIIMGYRDTFNSLNSGLIVKDIKTSKTKWRIPLTQVGNPPYYR